MSFDHHECHSSTSPYDIVVRFVFLANRSNAHFAKMAGATPGRRPAAIAVQAIDPIPAPSTATAKVMLMPSHGAYLDAPDAAAAGARRAGEQQPDRRLSVKAKLDLQRRLQAASLGSLLFAHRPSFLDRGQGGRENSRPASARAPDDGLGTRLHPATRPLTARPSTQRRECDVGGSQHGASLRVWASGDSDTRDASITGKTPRTAREKMLEREADIAALKEAGLWRQDDTMPEREQLLLRCRVNFKCQPDPRWKVLFQATAADLQQAVELERKYVEDMSNYSGKQVSQARVALNAARIDPRKAEEAPTSGEPTPRTRKRKEEKRR